MIFIDIEPTGMGMHPKNCILELGAEMWINGSKMGDFYVKMKPTKDVVYQKWNNKPINYEKAQRFQKLSYALTNSAGYKKFVEWLNTYINPMDKEDKAWLCAYNATEGMDLRLLRNWFAKNSDPYLFSYIDQDQVDIKAWTVNFLKNKVRVLKDRKLGTIYEFVTGNEIDRQQLHTASYDCALSSELYYAVQKQRDKKAIEEFTNDYLKEE